MTGNIYINGEIGADYKVADALLDVKRNQMNEFIILKINSVGGDVDEVEQIFNIFQKTGKIIRTENTGDVASAAVKLFLLAPKGSRFFDPSKGVFLIHNPWGQIKGDSKIFELASKELGKLEADYASFYSQNTGTDKEVLRGFMNINEPLTIEQIKELGFAELHTQQFQAVAKFNINNKNDEMTEQDKNWFEKLFAKIIKDPKALMIADATGKQLDFGDQITEASQIAVGLTAKFEDGTIPTGDITMPDGAVFTFDDKGTITAITEAPEEGGNEEIEELKAELEDLKAENANLKAKADSEFEAKFNAKLPEVLAKRKSEFVALMETQMEKKKKEITNRFENNN